MALKAGLFRKITPLLHQPSVVHNSPGLFYSIAANWSYTSHQCRCFSSQGEWQHAVSAAEKLVGPQSSYLTLRSLLSDEMSAVATHFKRLVTSSHPFVKTAKQLVKEDTQLASQPRGLLVLLVSLAGGAGVAQRLPATDSMEPAGDSMEPAKGLLQSQRSLAEITDMIHTAELIHKGVLNVPDISTPTGEGPDPPNEGGPDPSSHSEPPAGGQDLLLGNKLAILCGDYLLAHACKGLASLHNSQVVALVSSAISDFTASEFLGERDGQGRPLLSPDADLDYWRSKTFLAVGSLLAKSYKSALLLGGDTDAAVLDLAYSLGHHTALAWQGSLELTPFVGSYDVGPSSNVSRAFNGQQNLGSSVNVSKDLSGKVNQDNLVSNVNISEKLTDKENTQNKFIVNGDIFTTETCRIDVTSLPVIAHLQRLRQGSQTEAQKFVEALQRCRDAGGNVDGLVVQEVVTGGAGVQLARQVVNEHCQEALRLLQLLPPSDARTALANIIRALQSEQH